MKKISLLLVAVFLLPVVCSAQYMGYNPIFHNPEVQKEGNRQIAKAWRQFWKEDFPQFFSGQNGKGAFAPAWLDLTPAAQAVADAAQAQQVKAVKKIKQQQEEDQKKLSVNGVQFENAATAVAYCRPILAGFLSFGILSDEAEAVVQQCQGVAEVAEENETGCVAPGVLIQAQEEGKSWFEKNIIDVYLQGCASQGQALESEREAASATAGNLADLYKQGYQSQAQAYLIQTQMNQQTIQDIENLWNRISQWFESLAATCNR